MMMMMMMMMMLMMTMMMITISISIINYDDDDDGLFDQQILMAGRPYAGKDLWNKAAQPHFGRSCEDTNNYYGIWNVTY